MNATHAPSEPGPVSCEGGPTRILIVDDDDAILDSLELWLEVELPGIAVTKYHSKRMGRPGPGFEWSAHDLLLLDYDLGQGDTGVDWLEAYGGGAGFPPTVLLTAHDSAHVVGNAVLTGADGYLSKRNLNPQRLVDTVQAVLRSARTAARQESSLGGERGKEEAPQFRGRLALDTSGASYRFIREIGRGGMSRVYLAERSDDHMAVVLKILDRDMARDAGNVQRFAREGEIMARIDSPYVVKVFDHGSTNSYGYIAMEFFGRGDLAQRMAQGVTPEYAVLYLHNVARALEAIHAQGIVHRDLKPGNIMFRADDSMALVDFGLSKRHGFDPSLTEVGVILGTPYCMSPEQASGGEADHRSDLFAAGVMFYEMLTGERPFHGATLAALLAAIQNQTPEPLVPALARFQPVVDRLMAKDPDDRFQSASELVDILSLFDESEARAAS